ncbi:MAG: hypothetical protein WC169_11980, partial [Dehalococcoidia bacterium]
CYYNKKEFEGKILTKEEFNKLHSEIWKEEVNEEELKQNKLKELKNKLEEIDKKSIRAIRTSDIERIETLEKEAEEIRIELRKIS